MMLRALELAVFRMPVQGGVLMRAGEVEAVRLALPPNDDDLVLLVDHRVIGCGDRVRVLLILRAGRLHQAPGHGAGVHGSDTECGDDTGDGHGSVPHEVTARLEWTLLASFGDLLVHPFPDKMVPNNTRVN